MDRLIHIFMEMFSPEKITTFTVVILNDNKT